jgi:hypothetical protein
VSGKSTAKGGVAKGGSASNKKKKSTLKYTIDCTHPVEDGIMDPANFVSRCQLLLIWVHICCKVMTIVFSLASLWFVVILPQCDGSDLHIVVFITSECHCANLP